MKTLQDLIDAIGATDTEQGLLEIGNIRITQNKLGSDIDFNVKGNLIVWIGGGQMYKPDTELSDVKTNLIGSFFEEHKTEPSNEMSPKDDKELELATTKGQLDAFREIYRPKEASRTTTDY